MPTRKGSAQWKGTIAEGHGTVRTASGAVDAGFSFGSRFEGEAGTNPEELIAAAHAGCYSMALSLLLEEAGHAPDEIHTQARVAIEKDGDGFTITSVRLHTRVTVPGLDDATFQQQATAAKVGCPVSKALSAVDISLEAELTG